MPPALSLRSAFGTASPKTSAVAIRIAGTVIAISDQVWAPYVVAAEANTATSAATGATLRTWVDEPAWVWMLDIGVPFVGW